MADIVTLLSVTAVKLQTGRQNSVQGLLDLTF